MNRHPLGFAGCLILLALAMPAAANELRMGYASTWAMPWGEMRQGQVVGGIHHDLGQALARQLGWRLRFTRIPQPPPPARPTAAHILAHADLVCGMHPSWTADADAFHWSVPLFEIGDVLVGHSATPAPAKLSDLPPGTHVGTVARYRYPTLEARFADKTWVREDAPDQSSALRKLALRRTPVAVVSVQTLAWHRQQNPSHALAAWQLPVQLAHYHCVLPKGTALDVQAVMAALAALKRDGSLDRILKRYAPA